VPASPVVHNRAALHHGAISQAKAAGWTDRRTRAYGAGRVRVLDFEHALSALPQGASPLASRLARRPRVNP